MAFQAEREARIKSGSKAKRLEYWAKSGKAVSFKLSITDAFAVSQGIETVKLEVTPSAQSIPVDSDAVFNDLEKDRTKGLLAKNVTCAKIYYEASVEHPGFLNRVDAMTAGVSQLKKSLSQPFSFKKFSSSADFPACRGPATNIILGDRILFSRLYKEIYRLTQFMHMKISC